VTWGVHITLASRWLDPAETEGIITPFMFLYALHDAVVKPMPAGWNTLSLAESPGTSGPVQYPMSQALPIGTAMLRRVPGAQKRMSGCRGATRPACARRTQIAGAPYPCAAWLYGYPVAPTATDCVPQPSRVTLPEATCPAPATATQRYTAPCSAWLWGAPARPLWRAGRYARARGEVWPLARAAGGRAAGVVARKCRLFFLSVAAC
jgi:hypothetical protein